MLAETPFFLHLWTYVRSCSKHVHVVHADPVLIGFLGHIDSSKNHEEPVLGESFGKCVSVCISCLICHKTQRCAFGPPLPNHHSQMNQFAHRVITPSMVRGPSHQTASIFLPQRPRHTNPEPESWQMKQQRFETLGSSPADFSAARNIIIVGVAAPFCVPCQLKFYPTCIDWW